MSISQSPRNAEWQNARVPKLAYRKALPLEEAERLETEVRQSANARANNARRTESAHSSATRPGVNPNSFGTVPSKKKNSFFSGLFTKEPTLAALAQVEADLVAKHGEATPQSVPHVSSRKMPEHVPKVNSKWDGVPEAIKLREREEKRRSRASQQSGSAPPRSAHSRGTDDSARHFQYDLVSRSESDTASQAESWNTRHHSYSRLSRRNSLDSTLSSEYNAHLIRRVASIRSQSLRSPSGTSLPEITSFFPHHQAETVPSLPQRYASVASQSTYATGSSDQSQSDNSQRNHTSPIEVIPEHSSSPINTPRDMSPVTPSYISDGADGTESDNGDGQREKQTSRTKAVPIDAFLAGEARPLELNEKESTKTADSDLPLRRHHDLPLARVEADISKRPDTSRARLGLRASMVVNTEAVPWETQHAPPSFSASPGLSKNRLPKKALAIFK